MCFLCLIKLRDSKKRGETLFHSIADRNSPQDFLIPSDVKAPGEPSFSQQTPKAMIRAGFA